MKAQNPFQRSIFNYMSANAGLAKGYFTTLTPYFIGDVYMQHFEILSDIEEQRANDEAEFLTELFADDISLVSFRGYVDHQANALARADQAKFQRNWSAALTLGPWILQAAVPLVYRMSHGFLTRYQARRDQVLRIIFENNRALFTSEFSRIESSSQRRLYRLANRHRFELKTLGIKWDTQHLGEALHPRRLIEAAEVAARQAQNAGRAHEALAVTYAYRRLIVSLFEETRALQGMTRSEATYSRELLSKAFFGRQATSSDLELIRNEFRRLVLP
jgi:hypothetical protein